MNEDIKNYFSFNRRERRGIIALIILIILIFAGSYIISYFNKNEEIDISEFEKEIDQLISPTDKKEEQTTATEEAIPVSTPAPLDPNTASEEQWRNIGVSPAQFRVINNYLLRGGRFKSKEDLKKIYSITPEVYRRIEPYIIINTKDTTTIAATKPIPQNESVPQPTSSNLIIEINSADTLLLQTLPGIGPAFASRIFKYRNLLGGFYKKEQLLEVFGMDEERYSGFQQNISINPARINKLEINQASASLLQQHPYIDKQLSLLIVSYRNQHGKFRNLDDFRKLALVNDDLTERLSPYLSFD